MSNNHLHVDLMWRTVIFVPKTHFFRISPTQGASRHSMNVTKHEQRKKREQKDGKKP